MSDRLDMGAIDRRVQEMREALEEDDLLAAAVRGNWWSGLDRQYKKAKGDFATELIKRLTKSPGTGMTQKEIAELACMSESSLAEAKNGAISDEKLNRLIFLARAQDVPIPELPGVSCRIVDNIGGTVDAMALLSQRVGEENQPLDEADYPILRAVLLSHGWWMAVRSSRMGTKIASAFELLKDVGVDDRSVIRLSVVLWEWMPALVAVFEELDSVFKSKRSKNA